MDPTASLHPNPNGWLLNSVLAPHVDAFAEYLRQGRYSASTESRYLGSIAHFARWTSQSYLPVDVRLRSLRNPNFHGLLSRDDGQASQAPLRWKPFPHDRPRRWKGAVQPLPQGIA